MREASLYGGQILYQPGDPVEVVYFPSACSIAIITVMRDGRGVETASVGFEGAVGVLHAVSDEAASARMTVQIGGAAIALPATGLRDRIEQSPSLIRTVLRFSQTSAAQTRQSAACRAVHTLPARLASWLLVCESRVGGSTMAVTQDDLGLMVGALRSSVSLTASMFKQAGLIRYSRGRLEIVDGPGLERLACECYRPSCAHGRDDLGQSDRADLSLHSGDAAPVSHVA